jgi:hypothetical protein
LRRLEAEIILEYDETSTAEAVARAVSPDNSKTPKGLSVKTVWKSNKVITRIKFDGKLQTFIATLDDLLFCTGTAEKAVQTARKFK